MERFIRSFRHQQFILGGIVAACVLLLVIDFFATPAILRQEDTYAFRLGLATGIGLSISVILFRNARILRDEERLRQRYIEEKDERRIAIRAKAGMPIVLYLALCVLLASVVASYLNETVFKTLAITGLSIELVGAVAKVYYTSTM